MYKGVCYYKYKQTICGCAFIVSIMISKVNVPLLFVLDIMLQGGISLFHSIGTFQTDEQLASDFYIYECGFEDVKPRDPYQYQPIDYYLIHYILEGEGLFFINDEVHHLGAKQGFIIPPNTKNNYYPLVGNPWSYRWIGFKGAACYDLFSRCGLLRNTANGVENFTYRYENKRKMDDLFANVFTYSQNRKPYAAIGEAYHIINLFIEQYEEEMRCRITQGEKYVKYAIDMIEKNYDQSAFSVEQLAQMIKIERSYLYRLFKKYLNVNPTHYIVQYRINKSTELLKKSSSSIEEIAYLVGFNNPSHFSRQFSKCKGISPSKYRSQFKIIDTEQRNKENKLSSSI